MAKLIYLDFTLLDKPVYPNIPDRWPWHPFSYMLDRKTGNWVPSTNPDTWKKDELH